MTTSMLAAASMLAEQGRPVFPCAPNSKVPLYSSPHPAGSEERRTCRGECGRWGHGCLDATTDPEVITFWYRRTPSANVAEATGAPGHDVVDFDTNDGKPGWATFVRLRDAGLLRGALAVIGTPRGGWHLHFPGTDQSNGALGKFGVDFRSSGGYVLTPPSVVNGKPYVLHERRETGSPVDWAAIRRFLIPPRPRPRTPLGARGAKGTDGLIRWVREQEEGGRNTGLYWAACRLVERGADPSTFTLLTAAAVSAGLPESEAIRTVHSAQRRVVEETR